jgi:exodeoxyribonuclease VII large subunit
MTVSLFDLNEHLRRVVALNFRDPIWVTAEIAQASRSRGHWYLELVQKGEALTTDDGIVAQAQAVLWQREHQRLARQYGPLLDDVLREGAQVRWQVKVDFHERYGFKLVLADVDPTFTLGQLALQRRQTLEALQRSGLLQRNRTLPLPAVLQRVAVVTSESAAGFQDFQTHLTDNEYGYRFDCQCFFAAVQGAKAPAEVSAALGKIAARAADFDCVVLVRGGGARLDLAAFDSLEIGTAVGNLPLPVLAGIGHEVDETVLDLVAHTSLKTPTAVADFLVQHNLAFETSLLVVADGLQRSSAARLQIGHFQLERSEATLQAAAQQRLRSAAQQLDQAAALCAALDPAATLRRGYSLTLRDGAVVRSAADVQPGDVLETQLAEGVVVSRVE